MRRPIDFAVRLFAGGLVLAGSIYAQSPSPQRALVNQYCVICHNQKAKTAGLMLDTLDVDHPGEHAEAWEKVVRKLRGGMMPPRACRDRRRLRSTA